MTQKTTRKRTSSAFRPVGEMTIYSAMDNKAALQKALGSQKHLKLDLSQVSEIDTAGLQLLILAKLESQRQNLQLEITGHSPAVLEAIDLYSLSGFFGDPLVITSKVITSKVIPAEKSSGRITS